MKLAIDSYTFHRYFGEIYPNLETDPGSRMSVLEFVNTAHELGAQGVSLESCFMAHPTPEEIRDLKHLLNKLDIECVWAWGHPSGLCSGEAPEELHDLIRHTEIAASVGAQVMRICCGGRRTRPADWSAHKAQLIPLLRQAALHARDHGVVLAIENHIDFFAAELAELVDAIDSEWLGVCLDTANNLRMLEDPAAAIETLAPYARATHIKDVAAYKGSPREFSFWPSVPIGKGLVDMPRAFEVLKKHNYQGLLALEIDYLHPGYPDHMKAVKDSLAYMSSLL